MNRAFRASLHAAERSTARAAQADEVKNARDGARNAGELPIAAEIAAAHREHRAAQLSRLPNARVWRAVRAEFSREQHPKPGRPPKLAAITFEEGARSAWTLLTGRAPRARRDAGEDEPPAERFTRILATMAVEGEIAVRGQSMNPDRAMRHWRDEIAALSQAPFAITRLERRRHK
ncbi:hypothetical protein DFH01_00200 [Falsiroseomonas bella]|uniref:Uncharacterized protein n=2 Tax=Falsiroseomonas bella TaxID=2184016 RepID=A0A317FJF5_9PROT|nr:hypothetical protein DFH01_00200 [Falsiroseomonas bella]